MRADVIRYLIMSRIGGLYLDLDYEMLKPFDLTEHALVLPYSRNKSSGASCDRVGNCFFASIPGHPFCQLVIDDLAARLAIPADVDVEDSTGPGILTRIFERIPANQMEIHTPETRLFHPPTPRSEKEYRQILQGAISYGTHHCDGAWLERGLLGKVKNLFWRSMRRQFRKVPGR